MPLPPTLVLASASPRRSELLARVGLRFAVVPSDLPEEVLPGEAPEQHVLRLARGKALQVAQRDTVAGRWFLGSDTVVVRDDDILGKPRDAEEAATMLAALSGRRHRVLTGIAVHDRQTGTTMAEVVATAVRFKELTEREIAGYIASGEPFDKAGAYAIQGLGAALVRDIEGSYTNVVGLPLCEILEMLEGLGAARLFEEEDPGVRNQVKT